MAGMEVVAWLTFLAIVAFKLTRKSRFDFPMALPLVALVTICAISLVFNPPLKSFWYQFGFMRWIFLLWAFYWVFKEVWDPKFEKRFENVWTGVFFLAALYATLQCFTGLDPIHRHQVIYPQDEYLYKATGFFSISLTYAYSIGISYFLIVLPRLKESTRYLGVATLLVGVLGLLASMSKGAWLAAIVTGLFYLACMRPRWVPAFVAGLAGLGAALAALSPAFRFKLTNIALLRMDHSAGVRVDIWRGYWEMFKDHPWLGIGIFQGDKLLPEYYDKLGITQEFVSHAHNIPLQWAAGAGIFALLIYVYISWVFLKKAWDIRDTSKWGWPLLLSQIYWHLGSLTEANFIDGEVNHMIVFTWALLLCLSAAGRGEVRGQSSEDPSRP
ncbi:MAG: O-antigen ligase family protein [Bdellovibrionales bacterium]|nr:O-antigen ligase family protein [Bdellovibrionales bacterium]